MPLITIVLVEFLTKFPVNSGSSLPPGTSHLFSLRFWIPPPYPLLVPGGTFSENDLGKLLPYLPLWLTIAHQAQHNLLGEAQ